MFATFICAFGTGLTASADHLASLDKDGCWDGATSVGGPCLQLVRGSFNDKAYTSVFENQCAHRIVATFCNQQNDGNWECGQDGIGPLGRKNWTTYNATGNAAGKAVGADQPDKDWVCAGKYGMTRWQP